MSRITIGMQMDAKFKQRGVRLAMKRLLNCHYYIFVQWGWTGTWMGDECVIMLETGVAL